MGNRWSASDSNHALHVKEQIFTTQAGSVLCHGGVKPLHHQTGLGGSILHTVCPLPIVPNSVSVRHILATSLFMQNLHKKASFRNQHIP